jgi:hypothetical protein
MPRTSTPASPGTRSLSLALVAVAALAVGACKSEPAPKPATDDKEKDTAGGTSTYTNPWTNPYTDTSTFPGALGGGLDDGRCQAGVQPVFTSTGGTGTSLSFLPGTSVNWTFQARDAQNACVFEVYHVDAMGLPAGITVSNNDSAQVTLMGVASNTSGTGSMPSGNLTVKARNITACARTSSDYECRNYFAATGAGFDVTGSYQWTLGTGTGGNLGNNQSNSSNMAALGIGMQLISMLLGGGGSNPLSGLGGLSGGGLPGLPGGSTILPTSTFTGIQTGTNPGLQQGSCIGLPQAQCQANAMCQWDSFSNSCR